MPSWLLKSVVHHVFKGLPRPEWWNALMQRYVTGGLRPEPHGEFKSKLAACQRHLNYYKNCSRQPRMDFFVVEIGTGWFPIIPIGLYLCGAGEILTYDIVRLLRPDTFAHVVRCFLLLAKTGELDKILPDARPERVSEFLRLAASASNLSPVQFLERLNIWPRLGDVLNLPLANGSIDFLFSHGVLEHFSRPSLPRAMGEFRRICGWRSVMSHFIGMADQFSFFDGSITAFNNLRYSARTWRWLDSPIIPQNRLRASDYMHAYIDAGFEIFAREDVNGAASDLAKVKIAPEFARYSRRDLLPLYSWIVARPMEAEGVAFATPQCA